MGATQAERQGHIDKAELRNVRGSRGVYAMFTDGWGGKGTADANCRGRPVVILDSLVSMNVGSGVTTERRILTSQPDGGSARCRSSRVPGQPNDSCPSRGHLQHLQQPAPSHLSQNAPSPSKLILAVLARNFEPAYASCD